MRSSHRGVLPLAALTAMAILATAGCGRSAPSGGPGSTASRTPSSTTAPAPPTSDPTLPAELDPCVLVSKMDAETLVGTPLQDGVKVRETCTYTGPPTGPTAQVQVFIGDGAKKFLDTDRLLNHDFVQLSGIGDEAWLEPGVIFINKSGQWVCISLVRLVDPASYRTKFEALARTVAGRM